MFKDPNPNLVGPPTQTISGIKNKTPVVDNPNVKLPSQDVKNLLSDPRSINKKFKQNSTVNIDKTNFQKIKPDGLNNDWSPNKYSPSSISGNNTYVNPKNGDIQKINKKINNVRNTPRIKTVKIPRYDSTKGAQSLLNSPKSPAGK